MSVNSEMTDIADLIRGLRGVSGKMGLDAMKGHLQDEQDGLDSALTALAEKGVTVPDGTKVDGLAALIAEIEAGGGGNGKKIITGTITPVATVAELYPEISTEEIEAVFGHAVSNGDYKCIGGYYDAEAKNGLIAGAVHGLSFLGVSGSPHYYNGSSVTRGSASAATFTLYSSNSLRIRGYNSTYGFIAGRTYGWFMMEV